MRKIFEAQKPPMSSGKLLFFFFFASFDLPW
jgi:hypothetical protein